MDSVSQGRVPWGKRRLGSFCLDIGGASLPSPSLTGHRCFLDPLSRFDQFAHTDVTERDVAAFCHTWGLPVLRAKSVNAPRLADGQSLDGHAGLSDVAPLLNRLAEHLWRQDQVAAGLIPPSPGREGEAQMLS